MKEPVLATPLDQEEKLRLFESSDDKITEIKLLEQYIDIFLEKNSLQNYETNDIRKRKFVASLVLAAVAFLEIVYLALYHNFYILPLMLFEIVFYIIFFRRQNLKKYLVREVVRRPDDILDNILISQVSGAKDAGIGSVLTLSPLIAAILASMLIFMSPHMVFEKNANYGYALRYYTMSLIPEKDVVIPESYKGEPVVEIRGNVFCYLRGIETVVLPSGITEIRGSTFEGCSDLREIDIPEGVTRIGGHAFYACSSLQRVKLPSTVTKIGSSAFRRCDCLRSIDIPKDCDINDRAFKESPTVVNFY